MLILKYIKFKRIYLIVLASLLVAFHQKTDGQSIGTCGYASETLNLPAAPQNLHVIKTYKKTSELFYTLPDGKTIADFNSYDIQHMEPVKRIERLVYAKDEYGVDVVLKQVLDPSVQFKPTIEPYELMVLYPSSVVIYNRFGNQIYSTELDTATYSDETGEHGGGIQDDSSILVVSEIETDSIFQISGADFITTMDIPKGIMLEVVYDEFDQWIAKNISVYDPNNEDRSRPLAELNIARDTLPISGECVFRVNSTSYKEYCSELTADSSGLRVIDEVNIETNLRMTKWPNPVSSILNINVESDSPNEMVFIELFDLDGKMLYSTEVPVNQDFRIDVSTFMSGLHLIRARSGRDMIVERVVIQN